MKYLDTTIGARAEVGCLVTPAGGFDRTVVTGAAKGLLGAAGRRAAEARLPDGPMGSPFDGTDHRFGHLALTEAEIVLVATKQALVGQKPVAVLARAPRRTVAGIELGTGRMRRPLTVAFGDGSSWTLEVPAARAKEAARLVAAV
jgi:hypothetical protein